ncbi:unnamed protein product [Mytilus edulis]|uniref:C1q domain-containing protein n=1 Tax=Mytilus edulis TaxID=6550 RepID=A0A8S3VA55_MYTED|nr:unnamed protein product [Mytilus edulis]
MSISHSTASNECLGISKEYKKAYNVKGYPSIGWTYRLVLDSRSPRKRRFFYSEVIQSCFRIHMRNTVLQYTDYVKECDEEGGEMMKIDSEEKQQFIVSFLETITCSCKALGFPERHSLNQNNDNKIKERHNNEQVEPVVRNKYDVHTRKRLLVQPTTMQSSQIGFYAYMSQNENSLSKHHTIIFDVQKTNVGNGYNPFSGLFTAPQDGLYTFATSITMIHHYASFELVKNADVQGSFFVDADGESEWRSSSSIVVLVLVQGDVVFVRTSTTYVPHGDIHSSKDGRSSFTGWLIQ